jgi:hypothetical protein
MSTEEMIKQAFDKQAGRAGDHRRVLAEVTRRTSSRRRIGALGIVLLTAGVAAAVVTPVVLFSGGSLGPPAPDDPAQASAETVPPGTPVLKYQPAWLPEKATEQYRMSDPGGKLARGWKVAGTAGPKSDSLINLTLEKATGLPDRSDFPMERTSVDINGVQGQLLDRGAGATDFDRSAFVEWMVAPGERLTVRVDRMADTKDVVLRIAQSVRPDGNAAVVRNVSFGWLPAGVTEGEFQVSGTKPTDVAVLTVAPGDHHVTARIDRNKPGSDTPGASSPVTVRGKQGVYIAATELSGEVRAPLDNGLWLAVLGRVPKADLVKIADTMKISPDVQYPWIGQR